MKASKHSSAFKALLDRKFTLDCWDGSLVTVGEWATDGKTMFSLCDVIGPYIKRAEAMAAEMQKIDRLRDQNEADGLWERLVTGKFQLAEEIGWCNVQTKLPDPEDPGHCLVVPAHYIKPMESKLAIPFHADRVRMLKSLVDYDEVKLSLTKTDPAAFYRRGSLVAICLPFRSISPVEMA